MILPCLFVVLAVFGAHNVLTIRMLHNGSLTVRQHRRQKKILTVIVINSIPKIEPYLFSFNDYPLIQVCDREGAKMGTQDLCVSLSLSLNLYISATLCCLLSLVPSHHVQSINNQEE